MLSMANNEQNRKGGSVGNDSVLMCSDSAPERFVSAEEVAEFLSVERRMVLVWARCGTLPAHALGYGRRRIWRFRLSEVEAAVLATKKPVRNADACGKLRDGKRVVISEGTCRMRSAVPNSQKGKL
jgi:excisionase family DNA binding protein